MKTLFYAGMLTAATLAAYAAHAQTLSLPPNYNDTTMSPSPTALQQMQPGGLPPVKQAGNIQYVTGGIGENETQALEAVKDQYNLQVMSATTTGAFAGDTNVAILDPQGNTLVNIVAGPLLYAQLPPGKYVVKAENNGQEKRQTITVGKGKPNIVHLSWKAAEEN